MTVRAACIVGWLIAGWAAPVLAQGETLTVPTFGRIVVDAPAGPPRAVVLFLADAPATDPTAIAMSERLRDAGALVVRIDVRSLTRGLAESDSCAYPAGDLEELARNIQLRRKLPAYQRPLLVGYGSGAALAYASIASAPPETFAGAISIGFCAYVAARPELCEMRGLKTRARTGAKRVDVLPFAGLKVPWFVLHGSKDAVCSDKTVRRFVAATGTGHFIALPAVGHDVGDAHRWQTQLIDAYRSMVDAPRGEDVAHGSVPEVADLPLAEVPARVGSTGDTMAVIVTGDGGWAELDKDVAAHLAAAGVPVIGWSSLRYFWSPRTPEAASVDLQRIITHYTRAWNRPRVLLIGYSFGADVLPFLVTRLAADSREHVAGVALLGLSAAASFEFHVAEWFGGRSAATYRTVPEVDRITVPVLCVKGGGEQDSACPMLAKRSNVDVETIGEGHHFGGEYARVADAILRRR
jgi:type IV secretory pathway VirJ component